MWQRGKNLFHLLVAFFVSIWFGFPSKKLIVVGVTGTDGKTTVVHLIHHILKRAGKKVAMISTIGATINGTTHDVGFHVTTPSAFTLQKYMRRAFDAGAEYVVLEVTSHGLDQYRVFGIPFEIGLLTNISHEHLDYHTTLDQYATAKIKLLAKSKVAIVNRDDESYQYVKSKNLSAKWRSKNQKRITYGMSEKSDLNPKVFLFDSNLLGDFNTYNVLAAAAVGKELGIPDEDIRKAVATFKLPAGRQEFVYDGKFQVVVDFAHTPAAFAALLPEIKKSTRGRLIHVFGAAGERDSLKRPVMGQVASDYDDIMILTAEDPRSESVDDIMFAIESGISTSFDRLDPVLTDPTTLPRKAVFKIPDRKEAISYAISLARKGDTVLVTGKGHEKSMNLGQGEEQWDEVKVVQLAIEKKRRSSQKAQKV